MGTFSWMIYLTMFILDLGNQTRKRKYHVKKSWVENVPHQSHAYLNRMNCIKKMNLHSKTHFICEGIKYWEPYITIISRWSAPIITSMINSSKCFRIWSFVKFSSSICWKSFKDSTSSIYYVPWHEEVHSILRKEWFLNM